MNIVINCLGLPFNGTTINERSLGGSETAAYYMAKELAAQGHDVKLFTNTTEEGVFDKVEYINAGTQTENTPLGSRFHFYAEQTPHDILIIQRHPFAFAKKYASKINLWWVHDLAQVRNKAQYLGHMWNIDGILTVSEFHKQQWVDALGIDPDIVYPITNGVDLSLFNGEITEPWVGDNNYKKLLYSSRPERGLEHLVAPNGIMDRLWKKNENIHLYVCGYENTTEQMASYYDYLFQRCDELPNVTILGALTKQELADVQRQCDLHVYPLPGPLQPDFNEVSCITAMECMAAGLPMMVSNRGAIPETCKDAGVILMGVDDNGLPIISAWEKEIYKLFSGDKTKLLKLKKKQLVAAEKFSWSSPAKKLTNDIIPALIENNRSNNAIAKELLMTSDIYALKTFYEKPHKDDSLNDTILQNVFSELNTCYDFAFNSKFKEHYEAYYKYEKERGVNYGPENLTNNSRFELVSSFIADNAHASSDTSNAISDDYTVIDYGCAHGHYTINLAKRFPNINFIGIDIEHTNIEKAKDWAEKEELENVKFYNAYIDDAGHIQTAYDECKEEIFTLKVDFILAAEVVEHVADPVHLVDSLTQYLKDDGTMCITTPYGPWEAQGYDEHYPWRAHLYHFDKQDIIDMFGHHRDFNVNVAPVGSSKWQTPLGSYVYKFKKPLHDTKSHHVNYAEKINNIVPHLQTVSLCMLVKNAEETLLKCLNSVKSIVDEIIIGRDESSNENSDEIINNFKIDNPRIPISIIDIASPTKQGFAAARNETISKASGDWILWLDSDEFVVHPENIYKYLRNNQFNGYALQQHHISIEPVGILKTDLPVRLFRNHKNIKFFGVVHEHPEIKINEGVGHVQAIYDVEIAHSGYTTENIRRERFHRNIELLAKDREENPERYLGKFLWIRDLAQMSKYEMEVNGGNVTDDMIDRAEKGMILWEELLDANQLNMLIDGMEFYSVLSQILGNAIEAGFVIDTSKLNGGINLENQKQVKGYFHKKEHIKKLVTALLNEKTKDYDSQYF